MKKCAPYAKMLKSLAALAFVGGSVAAIVVWARNPRVKTTRLLDKCDDALSELEHRTGARSSATAS